MIAAAILAVGVHRLGRATAVVAAAAVLFAAAAPAAYAIGRRHAQPAGRDDGGSGYRPATAARARRGPGWTRWTRRPRGLDADNAELQALVSAADNRWGAASIGSMGAGSLELETGASVMAIGGFTGSDSWPTLEQFQAFVADGQVRYFIAGGRAGPGGDSGTASQITSWVEQTFTPIEIGGATVYDLDAPISK